MLGAYIVLFGLSRQAEAQTIPKFKVIAFYSASFDVAHISFAHEANGWFAEQAEKYNFQYDSTKNWDNLNASFLANYQVVMFLDDQPASASQRSAFQKYMEGGGGFIGFHVCAFNTNASDWDWYHNQFLATGSFKTNTWGPTTAVIKVEDNTHPATLGLPAKFTSAVSEWYGWNKDLRTNSNIRILCSIDPSSFPLGTDPNQSWYSGYYPVVWTNKNYKMLYANFGHNDIDYSHNNATKSFTFSNPTQNSIIINELFNIGGNVAPVFDVPGTCQAELYDVSNGVKKETTTDAGAGKDVGYIDAGDWMDYKVDVKASGSYKVEYRVASMNGGGSILLKSGNSTLATIAVPATAGWQTWTTVSATISLSAGKQTLRVQAGVGGYNLNWIKFTSDGNTNQAPTVALNTPLVNTNFLAPAIVDMAASASDADGSVSKVEFFNGTTKLGEDVTAPYTFTWTSVLAGTYSLTAKATDNAGLAAVSSVVTITVTNPIIESPYSGSPISVPGKIEAENYDLGGEGLAYHDLEVANQGGAYRTEGVDVQATTDAGGGYNVGYTADGEWMNYMVNVTATGNYSFSFRTAGTGAAAKIRLEVDGVDVTGTITLPNTGAWQAWATTSVGNVPLTAGAHTIRLFTVTAGYNLNYLIVNSIVPIIPPTVSLTTPSTGDEFTAPATINISATATDADGTISKVEFYNGTILIGTSTAAPYSFAWINVASGTYSISAKATDNSGASTISSFVTITVKPSLVIETPYGGTPVNIPGKIEAENYDLGGEGLAYHDSETANQGGAYRADGVDVQATTDAGGGYNVGYTLEGEWLNYIVNVTESGNYTFNFRTAGTAAAAKIRLEVDGVDLTGTVTLPNTGAWQTWVTTTLDNLSLTAGAHIIRLYTVAAGFNLNYITVSPFVPNQSPSVTLTAPVNNATANAPATIAIAAAASDADGTISKVEFYSGTVLLGSDATSPYTYNWTNVAAGTYSITAKATDNKGASSTSAAVTVKVNTIVITNPCTNIAAYAENSGYVAGSKVKNAGNQYQCKPYPYAGWCNGAAWAYGPGTGAYWTDAWTLVGSCSAGRLSGETSTDESLMSNAPNPFTGTTTVKIVVNESGKVSVKVYDLSGALVGTVLEDYLNAGTYTYEYNASGLKANVYLLKYTSESGTVIRKIVKSE
ncbi:MAG: Carbohydrate binding family 6 [Chitinophagaceae bacterium]|nr:Carbohydrate binding family 6 [Chitinophagaceae bacterium]